MTAERKMALERKAAFMIIEGRMMLQVGWRHVTQHR